MIRKLNDAEYRQIAELAERGMLLADCLAVLGFSMAEAAQVRQADVKVAEYFNRGRLNGTFAVCDTLLKSTTEGDVSAARLLLRRVEKQEEEFVGVFTETENRDFLKALERAARLSREAPAEQRRLWDAWEAEPEWITVDGPARVLAEVEAEPEPEPVDG